MRTIQARSSTLLVIDFQVKLIPAIDQRVDIIASAKMLIDAAAMLDVSTVFTEQNARGLGPTAGELTANPARVIHKMSFDACREPGFLERLPKDNAVVVVGCEAHVCVLQTVLGLIDSGRRVYVVRDAIGSRRPENKQAALWRMERHGADTVTAEMVVFEWLETAEHPRFRDALTLIK